MANLRPLAVNPATGNPHAITSPDLIDPSILPASSSAPPTTMTANFTLAVSTQTLFRQPIVIGPFSVIGAAGSSLIGV
jgi:hypothetical protein